jgi:DNA-binding NarL/FixJ family response regulator
VNILLVDDHPLMRAGLEAALAVSVSNAQIFSANAPDEARALLRGRADWDLVLLDLRVPTVQEGVGMLRAAVAMTPAPPVIVLSAEADPALVEQLRAIGARGFVSKSKGPDTLLAAIRMVLAGGDFFPIGGPPPPGSQYDRPLHAGRACPDLIPRVWQVYHLVSSGQTNKMIGRELSITEGAVKNYVTRLLEGLDARNRGEAISIYKENIHRWQLDPAYRGAEGVRQP